ncbi:GNAT family N-acetyltransferase [Allokutzneria sp. A3M-2-11 16]|uniref:GNAT family N-acetyltransferase n=1 Tax=Allokutzneria sp. A3M-2-11 16 TaxID=2962043 RepID=UPI0020B737B6|nr:GNAT family N-acetyltransferase [Allokutzneria sp. A3M-2-11 16]MCP3802216.1 GNAT family N-acetyltransferase [Allokutzneria sp. A3M-2-11 16]
MTAKRAWTVAPAPVDSAEAAALWREYYIDVADRYRLLHFDRRSTPAEIEEELADSSDADLIPPTGLLLLGRYDGEPAACAGLRVYGPGVVELKRVFVRPEARGTGGGACLLAAVDEAAIGMGAKRIVLDTRLDLVEARALYLKHGYTEIPAYNQGEYAEVWYGKELDV